MALAVNGNVITELMVHEIVNGCEHRRRHYKTS